MMIYACSFMELGDVLLATHAVGDSEPLRTGRTRFTHRAAARLHPCDKLGLPSRQARRLSQRSDSGDPSAEWFGRAPTIRAYEASGHRLLLRLSNSLRASD